MFNDAYVRNIKYVVKSLYRLNWQKTVADSCSTLNSSLRSYKLFKNSFSFEPYLLCVNIDKHRNALSRFRCSSHFLEIEKARHQAKIPPIWNRLCPHCKYAVDDELHLLLFCKQNKLLRSNFLSSIEPHLPNIAAMHHIDRFCQIMSSSNKFVLRYLAKYIYDSFEIRKNVIGV